MHRPGLGRANKVLMKAAVPVLPPSSKKYLLMDSVRNDRYLRNVHGSTSCLKLNIATQVAECRIL